MVTVVSSGWAQGYLIKMLNPPFQTSGSGVPHHQCQARQRHIGTGQSKFAPVNGPTIHAMMRAPPPLAARSRSALVLKMNVAMNMPSGLTSIPDE